MGRFAVESGDPAGTNNADEALKDASGKPVADQARNTQLTAAVAQRYGLHPVAA